MPERTVAGRYRLDDPIGRGGMGTVWRATDLVLDRTVAIKEVGLQPGESAPDAARAFREARTSAALNHPHVVSVFDVVEEESRIWLVMEHVEGRPLSVVIRDESPLEPERVAHLGAQIAEGLVAAHRSGTVHRDVKPGNILVDQRDVAKLSDFGIARRHEGDELTRTGMLAGTPVYLAPEVARGAETHPSADVWSLGATLFATVEGRPPYRTDQQAIAILHAITSEPVPVPERAGPLAPVIARMMDPDAATRWEMADAAAALRRVARGDVAGPAAGAGTSATTAVMGAGAGGAAGAGAAGPASASAGAAGPESAGAAADRGDDRGSGRRRGAWLAAAAAAAVLLGAVLVASPLLGGEDDAPRAGGGDSSPSTSSSASSSPSSGPSGGGEPDGPAASPTAAAEEYFAVMPQDTDAGWQRLAPSMRAEVGRGSYDEFWGGIDAVDLESAKRTGNRSADITLLYRFADGRVVRERQRVTFERSGGRFLIADDEVLSSQTVGG